MRLRTCTMAALLLAAFAASGQTIPNTTARMLIVPSGGPQYLNESTQSGPIGFSGSAFGREESQGHGQLAVDWGVIKLEGSAVAARTTTEGTFRDMLTITSPLVANGTPGVLNFSISVDGAMHAARVGVADWQAIVHLGGGTVDQISVGGVQRESGYSGDAFGTHSGQATFVFGQPLRTTVSLFGSVEGTGAFDLGHSLYWGGIQSLQVGGSTITDFDVASATGVDYHNAMAPVPEPGMPALLVAGMAVLGLHRRMPRNRRDGPANGLSAPPARPAASCKTSWAAPWPRSARRA